LFKAENVKLDDLRSIDRAREPPENGNFSDMIWADPCVEKGM